MGNCDSNLNKQPKNNNQYSNLSNNQIKLKQSSSPIVDDSKEKLIVNKSDKIKFSFVDDENADYALLTKIVLLGDSSTGKSSYLSRILRNEFNIETKSTIGVEFGRKMVNVNGANVYVQLWDTAGQERFRAITTAYYRGAHGSIIMYDITSRSTFDNVDRWVAEIRNNVPNASIILVGNKLDLAFKRVVSIDDGIQKAKKLGIAFAESSAMTAEGVNYIFEQLIVDICINKKY